MTDRRIAVIALVLLGLVGVAIGVSGNEQSISCRSRYDQSDCNTYHATVSALLMVTAGIGLVVVFLLVLRDRRAAL